MSTAAPPRALTAAALEEAEAGIGDTAAPFLVVSGAWPVGVIGLGAGRLAERHGRPALVLSADVEPMRGSARSAGGFDLASAFAANADLLERFGGHPAAAGCHVRADRVELLRERLLASVEVAPPVDPRPTRDLDLVVFQGGTARPAA